MAVTLAVWRPRSAAAAAAFCLIVVVFAYATVADIIERADGVKIAAFFSSAIVIISLVSRVWRTTELPSGEMRALDVKFLRSGQFVSLAIQNYAVLESLARSFSGPHV